MSAMENKKQEKEIGFIGTLVAIFNVVVRKVATEKVIFEPKVKGEEGGHM